MENEQGEFCLLLKGFKSLEDAKVFWDWFEGSGEQEAPIWFEGRSKYTYWADIRTKLITEGNTLVAQLKACEEDS